jgi:regulator of nonsense transcripts 1
LNEFQQQALKDAASNAITLIQGPPGTGKTTTAIEIVLQWCRLSDRQVLVCAHSNIAVDKLHQELVRAGLKSVRVGPCADSKNRLQEDSRFESYKELKSKGDRQAAASVRYMMM